MDETLRDLVDEAAASGPFQRLLAEPGPVVEARVAGPGHAFVAALLAHTVERPVLALALDPRAADALAGAAGAFLGDDRVVRFPAWESLPYEGISPTPEVAARRHEAARRTRQARGAFVLVAPVLAAMQASVPTLGADAPLVLERG